MATRNPNSAQDAAQPDAAASVVIGERGAGRAFTRATPTSPITGPIVRSATGPVLGVGASDPHASGEPSLSMTGSYPTTSGAWDTVGTVTGPTQTVVRDEIVPRGAMDIILLTVTALLISIGLLTIYSGSALEEFLAGGTSAADAKLRKQLLWVGIALSGLVVGSRLDYGWYWRLRYPILLGSYGLLALVLLQPDTDAVNNANRWLRLGGLSIQPAEIAKLAAVIYFSYSIVRKGENITRVLDSLVFHGVVAGIYVGLLMLQPDMGSSVIIATLLMVMLWVGGARLHFMIGLGLLGIVGLIAGINVGNERIGRVQAWLDPWAYADGDGYQLVNSYVALARGGFDGVGLGEGRGRMGYIPELYNDFIAAGIGEEFGLLGIASLCALYLLFFWRGTAIAIRARDRFGFLLAFGITFLVTFQAGFNLCVVTGILPTKGLTLPFVSYGGSSLVILCFAVGILLNIGQVNPDVWAERRAEEKRARLNEKASQKKERVSDRRRKRDQAAAGKNGG